MTLKPKIRTIAQASAIITSLGFLIGSPVSTSAATFAFQAGDLYLNDFGLIDSDFIDYSNLGLSPSIPLEETLAVATLPPQTSTGETEPQADVSLGSVFNDLQRLQWRVSDNNRPIEVPVLPRVQYSRLFQGVYEFEPTSPRQNLNNQPRNFVLFNNQVLPSVVPPARVIPNPPSNVVLPSPITLPRATGIGSTAPGVVSNSPGAIQLPQPVMIGNTRNSLQVAMLDSELTLNPKNELSSSVDGTNYNLGEMMTALGEFGELEPEVNLLLMPTASMPTPLQLNDELAMPSTMVSNMRQSSVLATSQQEKVNEKIKQDLEKQQKQWEEQRRKNEQEAQKRILEQQQRQAQLQQKLERERQERERRMEQEQQKRQQKLQQELAQQRQRLEQQRQKLGF